MTAPHAGRRKVGVLALCMLASLAIVFTWGAATLGATFGDHSGTGSVSGLSAGTVSDVQLGAQWARARSGHHAVVAVSAPSMPVLPDHTSATTPPTTAPPTTAPPTTAAPATVPPTTVPPTTAPAQSTTVPVPAATTTAPSASSAGGSGVSGSTYAAWSVVAECETGGNWSMEGSVFSGGLGIRNDVWAQYGGTQYAPTAGGATPAEQILIAEQIQPNPPDQHGCTSW